MLSINFNTNTSNRSHPLLTIPLTRNVNTNTLTYTHPHPKRQREREDKTESVTQVAKPPVTDALTQVMQSFSACELQPSVQVMHKLGIYCILHS